MDSYRENKSITKPDISASYQQAIVDVLVSKLKQAVVNTDVKTCVIAGGVAANKSLRNTMNDSLKDIRVLYPDVSLCTDNGAMIAYLGELYLTQGVSSAMDFDIDPNLKLA